MLNCKSTACHVLTKGPSPLGSTAASVPPQRLGSTRCIQSWNGKLCVAKNASGKAQILTAWARGELRLCPSDSFKEIFKQILHLNRVRLFICSFEYRLNPYSMSTLSLSQSKESWLYFWWTTRCLSLVSGLAVSECEEGKVSSIACFLLTVKDSHSQQSVM